MIIVIAGVALAGCGGRNVDNDTPPQGLLVEEIRARKGNLVPEGTLLETKSYYVGTTGEKILHGPVISFYENGKKWRHVKYRHGRMDGWLVEYSLYSGEKTREEHFRNGQREGLSVQWHSKGRKQSECTYQNDRIVGKRLYWNSTDGGLRMEEVYDANGKSRRADGVA